MGGGPPAAAPKDGAQHVICTVPDGGLRAWAFLGAYGVCCFCTIGLQYCFGLLYVEILADPSVSGATPELAALAGSVSLFTILCGAPLAAALEHRVGGAACVRIGAALASLGLAASSTVRHVWQLCLTYGVLVGAGHSLGNFTPILILPKWFDKRFARAMALANSCTALAPLIFGIAVPYLFDTFGWRASLLCLALFQLVLLSGASSLIRPPPTSLVAATVIDAGGSGATSCIAAGQPPAVAPVLDAPAAPRPALCDVARHRKIQLLGCAMLAHGAASWAPVVHLVAMGTGWGLTKVQASNLISFMALGNGTLRVPIGCIADSCGGILTFAACSTVLAVLYLCALHPALSSSHAFLGTFSYLAGGLVGGLNALMAACPRELLPPDSATLATSIMFPHAGFGMAIGPVAVGALHVATGSYDAALLCCAVTLLCESALLTALWRIYVAPALGLRATSRQPAAARRRQASSRRAHAWYGRGVRSAWHRVQWCLGANALEDRRRLRTTTSTPATWSASSTAATSAGSGWPRASAARPPVGVADDDLYDMSI